MSTRLILTTEASGNGGKDAKLFESEAESPEVFIEGVQGLSYVAGIVKINCFRRPYSMNEDFERREVACRLVMSQDAFNAIAEYMTKHAGLLKEELAKQAVAQGAKNV